MTWFLVLLIIWSLPAAAQDYTTDAFGVLPTDALGDRANWAGLREGSDNTRHIQQAGESDAAILFVGPKSIVAGIEPGHAVVIGLDEFGNMLDGVQTQFALGFGDIVRTETQFGIGHRLFRPPPKAGEFLAGATVGEVQSSRADYRVTAHLATVQPKTLPIESRQKPETFGSIATEPLTDSYGNLVDDGVGLNMILTDLAGEMSLFSAIVRDGAAQATVLSRNIAGPISGRIALAGTEVGGLRFDIDELLLQATSDVLAWPEDSIEAIHLRLGPLQTSEGYLVPDGTLATIDIVGREDQHSNASSWVLDGYVAFTLPLPPEAAPFELTLNIAGNVAWQRISLSEPPRDEQIRGAE